MRLPAAQAVHDKLDLNEVDGPIAQAAGASQPFSLTVFF
jgi:hypothetical protein